MIEQDTIKLLRECDAGIKMGITSIDDVLEHVQSDKLHKLLTDCRAERPKLNPHIPEMQRCLADVMQTDIDNVSIKATTTEKLGFTGRMEGISAYATVLIEKD